MSEHADLVERAVRWLRRDVRCELVLAEMATWKTREIPDAIGWAHGSSHVVEVKISRADFFADTRKSHATNQARGMGCRRWYLVPDALVAPAEVVWWAGLLYARGRRIEVVRAAPVRPDYDRDSETKLLIASFRRFELGVPFDRKSGRFATVEEGRERARRELLERSAG